MTDDNSTNLVDIPESLADFKNVFNGNTEAAVADSEDTEDNALATDEDTDAPAPTEDEDTDAEDTEDDGASETEDDESDDEEDEPKPEEKPKSRKSNYQERINELTRARRETERQNAELLRRLEALEASTRSPEVSKQETPIKDRLPSGAPDPDAVGENGDPKYPLGAFDPQYIFDLSEFNIERKIAARDEQAAKQAEERQRVEAQQGLVAQWTDKLDKYEEEVPEIRDHIQELVDEFQSVEPSYGEYIAMTIMQCENGPAIMDYLSQNIGEAQNIVASGPAAATLEIGRLSAQLSKPARPVEEKRNKKPSGAPPPPSAGTRGSRGGQQAVRPDTDNYAAFKKDFLSK